jgi:hypothetical protein
MYALIISQSENKLISEIMFELWMALGEEISHGFTEKSA